MKYLSLILFSTCIISLLGCDSKESPLTDPVEIYEKAVLLVQDGSFKQAKPLLEQAVNLFSEQKKVDKLTKALTSLVSVHLQIGEFRAALDASGRAAALMRKEGDVRGEVKLTLMEGDIYLSMRMYGLAIERYRTAYASATAFDDKTGIFDSQLKLASALKTGGDLDEAQEIFKNVLAQGQVASERQYIAAALGGIGSIYRIQNRNVEAINSLTQGLSSISKMYDPLLTAQLQEEIGLVHSAQNNPNAALRDFREAINTLRRARIGKDYETALLFQFGNLYEQNGKLTEAKRYYTEAMELARSLGDRIAENYLYIFLVRCNFNLMTPEQRQQNKGKLLLSYDQISKKFQECGHITGEGFLYSEIGKEYELEGDLSKARNLYLKAVTLDLNTFAEYFSEELHAPYQKALGVNSSHSDWYELLSTVLVKLDRPEEALKILELKRIKQLSHTFQGLEVSLRHPIVSQQTKNLQLRLWKSKMLGGEYSALLSRGYSIGASGSKQQLSDNNTLNALYTELESAKQNIKTESRKIIAEFPNYEALVVPSPVDVASIRKYIPQGALAIEFLPAKDMLYIFALTRSQLNVRTSTISRDSLLQLMSEYKRLLHDPTVYSGEAGEASIVSMTRFATLSTQLYECLLRPIDDLLEQSIIIVVDNEFEGFPFHSIERQDGKGNVKYVIEFTSVDYIPSLSSLRYRTASTARLQDVVAFGNPTGKNWSVDYELRDIRSFFKGATVMIGLETSWNNLKSIKADILQLSTEFSQPSTELPLGNLVLSNGLMVEQSITVPFEKLSELDAIPVMVLSNHYGQGIGLSAENAHLLRLNGTSDVFFNAWLADRKAAKFFSEYFFTHIANGLAPGDAYRQALLNLIRTREVSHPRSWGQFFHFGVG